MAEAPAGAMDGAQPGAILECDAVLGARTAHLTIERGEGPPLILISGCGMPSYVWDPVVRHLPGRQIVRLDRPGMGGTPWPDQLPTLAEETDTLIGLAEQHPGGVFVAHSMASFHAEAAIRRRPELVAGLVLVDGSAEPAVRKPIGEGAWLAVARAAEWAAQHRPLAALGPVVDRITVTAQSRRRLLDPMDSRSLTTYASADAVASVITEWAGYRRQANDLLQLRAETRWPIGLPVEVITAGRAGGGRWVAAQRELAELLGGNQTVLPDSRHLVMLDEPHRIASVAEQVLAVIAERTERS